MKKAMSSFSYTVEMLMVKVKKILLDLLKIVDFNSIFYELVEKKKYKKKNTQNTTGIKKKNPWKTAKEKII